MCRPDYTQTTASSSSSSSIHQDNLKTLYKCPQCSYTHSNCPTYNSKYYNCNCFNHSTALCKKPNRSHRATHNNRSKSPWDSRARPTHAWRGIRDQAAGEDPFPGGINSIAIASPKIHQEYTNTQIPTLQQQIQLNTTQIHQDSIEITTKALHSDSIISSLPKEVTLLTDKATDGHTTFYTTIQITKSMELMPSPLR